MSAPPALPSVSLGVPRCSEDTAAAPGTAPGRAPAATQDVQLAPCLFFQAVTFQQSV